MATINARPNEEVESTFEAAPTGLVGTVGVAVYNLANGAVVLARSTAGISEIPAGSGFYYTKVKAPGTLGNYGVVWDTGVISPTTSASDTLVVTAGGHTPEREPEAHNLVTLEQVKIEKGIDLNDHKLDVKFEYAIAYASEAIRKYCDRSFGIPLKTETRVFDYDISGFIDIDDATAITNVEMAIGTFITPIQPYAWRPEPAGGPIFDYLAIPHWAGAYSPEMGFTYNLDVISRERGWPGVPPTVKVTGSWGWPEVPADVQAAAVLTAILFADDPDENISESIENYAFSRGGSRQFGAAESVSIPGRARDLLSPYVRPLI